MRFTTNPSILVVLAAVMLCGDAPSWAQFMQRGSGTPAVGQETSQELNVTADKLEFGDGGSQIEASGNVEIKRQQTTIKADEVRMNRVTQDVEAKGHVSVADPEWRIKSADAIQMNLEKETGEIQNGDIFLERGHVSMSGRRLQKFTGQSYHIDEAFFTTCLCESGAPSWRISAESMDLSLEGAGIIRNGYFYILDVPVFYLPYGAFPLRSERQTGFLFPKIGNSTRDGFRFQLPFFWAISKSADATFAADIESRSRVGLLSEVRTKIDRDSDFQLNAAYFNESFRKNEKSDIVDRTIADQDIPVDRWSINGTHRYLTGAGWLAYSDIAAYSDDLFTRELIDRFDLPGTREIELRRSRYGESRFGLFRGWSDTFIKGEWNFYQDFIQFDKTTLQRTPQFAFWGRRFLSNFPLEFRWRAEGVNYLRREGSDSYCGMSAMQRAMCGDGLRFDLRPEAVLPFRAGSSLFGALSLAPRGTYYHLYSPVKKSSDHNVGRQTVEVRSNLGTSLSRIFAVDSLGFTGIKHVIDPEISYLFVPGNDQSRIPIMDGTDRINRRNVITFAIANRFWGKSASLIETAMGEKDVEVLNPVTSGAVRDLGSLKLALSYDIDKERHGGDSLSDLDINLSASPLNFLTLTFDSGINPGAWQLTRARASLSISDPRPITRKVLDPDFNRPNSVLFSYYFFRRGPNGFLGEDANVNLDAPSNCAIHPDDPRCPGAANQNVASNLGGHLLYHLTDRLLFSFSASYDLQNHRFPGFRTSAKILSGCECWSFTLSLKKEINPAKTSFNFDFNLLGLGPQKSTIR
ncbi:MAG: LPS-assembly protein LptD [Deltaproteobacteria bacterium]|nr:LPS-assembly protein LptD [Deltaproteobacteria bacterium]